MSDLERVLAANRRALLAREVATTAALLDAWGLVWDALSHQLAALLADMAAARAAGEELGIGWLYRQARYRALLAAIAEETARYALTVEQRVVAAQRLAATAGWREAAVLLEAQGVGIAGAFEALPVGAMRELVGALADGSPLASLLDGLGRQAAEGARRALVVGVGLGQGPREIARQVRLATNVVPVRAATISRTESLRAYRGASLARFRESADVLDGWMWSAAKDRRTCAVCLAKDGSVHRLDEPFASHPNCRCVPVPLVSGSDALAGYEVGVNWFAEQDAAVQRDMLGEGKYRLYAAGEIDLGDLVAATYSARWGAGLRERTLAELLAREALAAD